VTQTAENIEVTGGKITVQDFTIQRAPLHRLSGVVRDDQNNPMVNATVTILGTPITAATSDAAGAYLFNSVPEGTYDVKAQAGRCNDPQTLSVTLDADRTLDFSLPARRDAFGYTCAVIPQSWVSGTTAVALTGDDNYATVSLPFKFPFYGGSYTSGFVTTNGYVSFGALTAAYANTAIPNASVPNLAVYALWDDLYMDASSSLRTATIGSTPNRQFVVEWSNIGLFGNLAVRLDLDVLLGEDGSIITQYRNLTPGSGQAQGGAATLGIENATGNDAFQYSFNESVVSEGLAIRYALREFTGIRGVVTDKNDGLPIAGATVSAGTVTVSTPTSGAYRMDLPAGAYQLEASAPNYAPVSAQVTVTAGQSTTRDFALGTGRLVVSPTHLAFNMKVGQSQTQTVTVSNTGTDNLVWQLFESGDVTWLSETPLGGTLGLNASQAVQVTVDSLPVGFYSAVLSVTSNAAKQPLVILSVSVYVTAYSQGVNAGGPGVYDSVSTYWAPDQVYKSSSGWGYSNSKSTTMSAKKVIAGTPDQALFHDQRVDPGQYQFDLPSGTYQVTLYFAELKAVKVGDRVFDVTAEGAALLTGYDIMKRKGGPWIADSYSFLVSVADGHLNLAFVGRPKLQPPVVNAIRVQQVQ
jgi:malectin (di-glucose binding ER protein)/carboxypeptidase family protein/BACON domain-containing protein